MIILLKLILGLFIVLDFFVARYLYLDLKNTIKSGGYENSTMMQRFTVNFILYFMLAAQISLAAFLLYFIIIPITIG